MFCSGLVPHGKPWRLWQQSQPSPSPQRSLTLAGRRLAAEAWLQCWDIELILPSDVACGDEPPAGGKEVGFKVVSANSIPDGWLGLDNGPEASKEIEAALADCQTIICNGPTGVSASPQFAGGTYDIAQRLAELTENGGANTIMGGGYSAAAVNKCRLADENVTYLNWCRC